jgi:hypothetical protein
MPVLGQEIGTCVDKEGCRLGKREHGIAQLGEDLLDALRRGGLAGTRTAGKDDFCNHTGLFLAAAKIQKIAVNSSVMLATRQKSP